MLCAQTQALLFQLYSDDTKVYAAMDFDHNSTDLTVRVCVHDGAGAPYMRNINVTGPWIVPLLATLLMLAACATVPLTGRTQLNLVSDAQLIAAANTQFGQFMAAISKKDAVLKPSESPAAAQAIALVERVSLRILDAAGLRGKLPWQTVVVKAREANAA